MSEFEKVRKHFNTKITPEMEKFVDDVVFLSSRYIFTYRRGHFQYGYCTHCKQDFRNEETLRHGSFVECPQCGSHCQVKASGRGHKYLQDRGYFVFYEKSLVSPNAMVARGYFVYRDYSRDYRSVETKFYPRSLYLFDPGNKGEMYEYADYHQEWIKNRSVYSLGSTAMSHIRCYRSLESIQNAVKDTPFQYSTWGNYYDDDHVKFFSLASAYPSVEYLTKLGFSEAVEAKLYGNSTYSAINWRGKSIDKVLKLPKQILKMICKQKEKVDLLALKYLQMGIKDGSKFSINEAIEISNRYIDPRDLGKVSRLFTLRKTLNYIKKQLDKDKQFRSERDVILMLDDYYKFCRELGMDLNDEYIHFPPHLRRQHDNLMKQVKLKKDALIEQKIHKRVRLLNKKYIFESGKWLIRPAVSAKELIAEGEKLHHCVGTYTERYANGKTNILFVRKKSAPNVPYVTVEVRDNQIRQAYAHNDTQPPKEVEKFLERFTQAKLKKKVGRKVMAV